MKYNDLSKEELIVKLTKADEFHKEMKDWLKYAIPNPTGILELRDEYQACIENIFGVDEDDVISIKNNDEYYLFDGDDALVHALGTRRLEVAGLTDEEVEKVEEDYDFGELTEKSFDFYDLHADNFIYAMLQMRDYIMKY